MTTATKPNRPKVENSARPSVKYLEITTEDVGQRLDNFLLRELKGVPKSHIYRLLRKGEVRVNKGRVKPVYRLKLNDIVRLPPIRLAQPPADNAKANVHSLKFLEQAVLFEDERLLVINKPAGMAVHGGSGQSYGVIEALRALRPNAPFLELVHRLDRETSGCLIIAKKRSALRNLHEQMRGDGMQKYYKALLVGEALQGGARDVKLPLRKFRLSGGERVVEVAEAGDESAQSARSRFVPEQRWPTATLAKIQIFTGRTHQIRVHAVGIGHPVAGDIKYGAREANKQFSQLGLKRMFLHACELRFKHPLSGERMTIEAPLPEELQPVLNALDTAHA